MRLVVHVVVDGRDATDRRAVVDGQEQAHVGVFQKRTLAPD